MDYTQNLHLPQWEETDRIQMDDFNDAMSKLDAGIASAMKVAPIKTITVTELTSQIDIDVSDIDWSQWRCIILEAKLLPSNGSGAANLQVNGSGNGCAFWGLCAMSYQTNSLGQVTYPGTSVLLLFPARDPERTISCMALNTSFQLGFASNIRYTSLSTLSLVPYNNQFYPNSYVRVSGIK